MSMYIPYSDCTTLRCAPWQAEIRSQRDEQIRAAHRLKELQSKLLVGGENLLEKAQRQLEEQRRLDVRQSETLPSSLPI